MQCSGQAQQPKRACKLLTFALYTTVSKVVEFTAAWSSYSRTGLLSGGVRNLYHSIT